MPAYVLAAAAGSRIQKYVVGVAILSVVVPLVFRGMVKLERSGRQAELVTVIFALLLLEGAAWEQTVVPIGPFHPVIAHQSFRDYEILIPMALAARVWVRGLPRRIGATGVAMAMWSFWYTTAAIVGLIRGNNPYEILFEVKAVVYVGGSFALAAGIPAAQYGRRRGLLALVRPFAIIALALVLIYESKASVNIPIPSLRVHGLTNVGADVASLFGLLAVFLLVTELCRRKRTVIGLLALPVLLISVIVAGQRAALLGLAVSLLVVLLASLSPTARRRMRITFAETIIGVVTLLFVLALTLTTGAIVSGKQPSVPFANKLHTTFYSTGKAQSASSRVSQYDAARKVIAEQPILGTGLARTITYYDVGTQQVLVSPLTHDIATDLLLRSGVVGLLLFAASVGLSLAGGIKAWRKHPDPAVAAIGLACVAIGAGLLAKGLVESIFEKYRLAMALGLVLGMARSAATSMTARGAPAPVTDSNEASDPEWMPIPAGVSRRT